MRRFTAAWVLAIALSGEAAARPAATSGNLEHPYAQLRDRTVKRPGRDFNWWQRKKILDENRRRNGGVLRSDDREDPYQWLKPAKLVNGREAARPNDAVVDHIQPRAGTPRGKNSYSNARVVSRAWNLTKSDHLQLSFGFVDQRTGEVKDLHAATKR